MSVNGWIDKENVHVYNEVLFKYKKDETCHLWVYLEDIILTNVFLNRWRPQTPELGSIGRIKYPAG
jgi:hypothetical protein